MSFAPDQIAHLVAKLHPDHIKTRKMAGRTISYIEGWQAIAEANRIFGFDGWTRETVRLEETNRDLVTVNGVSGEYKQWRVGFLAVVKVVVFAGETMVTRHGTGFGSGMGKPEALSEAIESAAKEAETDAMKRAMMTFGNPFGLALYDKKQENVGVEPSDRFAPNAAARKSSAAAKRDGDWEKMLHNMADAKSAVSMQRLWDDYRQNEYGKWNPDWQREADELFAHRIAQFSSGGELKETLEDSVDWPSTPEDAATKAQVELFRERANWLKSGARTPAELKARAKNPEHLAEMAKLTEGQVRNLRELYSEKLAELQAQMMAAG